MTSESKSAVIVLDEPFWKEGQNYFCDFQWWRFADELARWFSKTTLFVPLGQGTNSPYRQQVHLDHARIEGRFHYEHISQFLYRYPFRRTDLLKRARQLFCEHDLVIFRVPAPIASPLSNLARCLKKPTVLVVAGHILSANRHAGRKNLTSILARFTAQVIRYRELIIARRSILVGVWGNELLADFSRENINTVIGASPNISDQLFYQWNPESSCEKKIQLLRVSRLLPTKGIEYLLESVGRLRQRMFDVELDIAGGTDDPQYFASLVQLTKRLNIQEYVRFHGQMHFDEELFNLYRRADIHVVNSDSEGLPRCIAEGRVFGLPTLATRVGGIPTVVHHGLNGLLIDPKKVDQLTDAIEKLIADDVLRKAIIENGYKTAEKETREFQAKRLAALIYRALDKQPLGPGQYDLHTL